MTTVIFVAFLDRRHEENENEREKRGPDVERADSGNQLDQRNQEENEIGDSTELFKEVHKQKVPDRVFRGNVHVSRKSFFVLIMTVHKHIQKHHRLHTRLIGHALLPNIEDCAIQSALAWVDIHVGTNHVELFLRISGSVGFGS